MYDVYGLGNALVDMEYTVDDTYLTRHGVAKGHMTLVDEAKLEALVADLDGTAPEQMSGGSAANSLIAVQAFGARTFYSCKVSRDATGKFFLADLESAGVDTNANAMTGQGKSGHCLILITPDAERSMNTCLGISSELGTAEVDARALARSKYFYVEGYLSSSEGSMAAAISCRELAESENVKTAVSLSDPAMVEFCREPLTKMLGNGVDHLFCNEEEALAWANTDRLDIAVTELLDVSRELNVTLGAKGCLVASQSRQSVVPGYQVDAVDTTGAGDMYAGGCLYGWTAGMSSVEAAAFGNYAAAQLVQHLGGRLRKLEFYGDTLRDFRNDYTAGS